MSADEDREYSDYVLAALDRLRRTAFLLCGDVHRADDIVQATLIAVYARWSTVRAAGNVDGYVHRILVRRYIDERRTRWARVLLTWWPTERAAPPGCDVEDADVRRALVSLTSGQRAVLVLRFFCDKSVEETAATLGCSTGTVKSQTARGLAAMRTLLNGQWTTTGTRSR